MVSEKKHFLNTNQKEIKQKIMEESLDAVFENIRKNESCFDPQSILDLLFSILVMFNREIIFHLISSYNLEHNRKEIMKNLFSAIKYEVDRKVKEGMM